MLVRKGAILPMMPVMQYIHEKKDYPITLKVYPGSVGQKTEFRLYEDDGTTTDYLKQQYSTTQYLCETSQEKISLTISAPENKGYAVQGKRSYELVIRLEEKPGKLLVNNKKYRYKWEEASKTCTLLHPVAAEELLVEILKK